MFGPYFDRVAARATKPSYLVEVRRARREFQDRTGRFEEEESWFEQRMTLFVEWFVLDRDGSDGLNPAERFLMEEVGQLSSDELGNYEGLASTLRTLGQIEGWKGGRIELTDMIGGGIWSIHQDEPMVGLQRGDLLDLRIVPFRGELYLGRGMIFHPRIARESILNMLEQAHSRGKLSYSLVDLLASQRLRFERYRNINVKHIYKLPEEGSAP